MTRFGPYADKDSVASYIRATGRRLRRLKNPRWGDFADAKILKIEALDFEIDSDEFDQLLGGRIVEIKSDI